MGKRKQRRPDKSNAEQPLADGLLYGRHAVYAALANPHRTVRQLMCAAAQETDLARYLEDLPDDRRAALPEPAVVERNRLDELAGGDAVHQGLIAAVAPLDNTALEDVVARCGKSSVLVVLDQVTDPHNIGAVLRSAAAFGAEAVIVQDRHSPQAGAALAKTASGALDVLPLVRVTNLARALDFLKESGFWCIGLAEGGSGPLHRVDLTGRVALVLGAEGDGLRRLTRETCDLLASLPTRPPIRSLNVSATAAIALHHAALARLNHVD